MDNLELSLEPKEKPEDQIKNEGLELAHIIPRITQERGAFANLSEEELRAEIDSLNGSHPINVDDETEPKSGKNEEENTAESDEENEKMKEEEEEEEEKHNFDEARRQLSENVSGAMNESALALDFVSLLLSCLRPAAGSTSMSPMLKEHVQVGALSADALTVSIPEENPRVGAGWKLDSLGNASDTLSKAAKRLKNEVSKEGTYWKSVFETVNAGEVLFKIRRGEARGLGIKYGFADAGSNYRDHGTALIKRKDDGTMSFKFDKERHRKVMRVTLYDSSSGELAQIGCSSFKNALVEETSVQQEIQNARRLIFEEELFHEIVREARRLTAYKVQVVNGKVVVSLQDHVLEIDHIDPTLDYDEMEHSTKADVICNTLKILLCDMHRRNLDKRRSDPAPLNSKQPASAASAAKSTQPMMILRPLIMHILHQKLLKRTSRLLDMILQGHSDCKLDLKRYSKDQQDTRLGKLLQEPFSTYTLVNNRVTVDILASSPVHPKVPLFQATAKDDQDKTISSVSLYELGELEEWINWILKK